MLVVTFTQTTRGVFVQLGICPPQHGRITDTVEGPACLQRWADRVPPDYHNSPSKALERDFRSDLTFDPLRVSTMPEYRRQTVPVEGVRTQNEGEGRILVVDDDVTVNAVVGMALEGAGYSVSSAENGEMGWEALSRNPFDLLITDYSMPKLNGIGLLRRMRANSVNVPAILMSAAMPPDVGEIIELVAAGGALHKPFAMKELLAKVGNVLDNGQRSTTDASSTNPKALGASGRVQRAILQNAAQAKLTGLASNILAHESVGKTSGDKRPVIFRVCEKIRDPLRNLAGETGFRSILARALMLSKSEVKWLWPVKISVSGFFEGLASAEEKLTPLEVSSGETVMVAQILGLLFTFLGESMTLVVLRDAHLGTDTLPG
jgi:CheY-like chemotaxis protein